MSPTVAHNIGLQVLDHLNIPYNIILVCHIVDTILSKPEMQDMASILVALVRHMGDTLSECRDSSSTMSDELSWSGLFHFSVLQSH